MVGSLQSGTVWTLLHTPGLRLMDLVYVEAYVCRFPYLSHLLLPRGAIDLAADQPSADTVLLATKAMLAVRKDTHPVLLTLLMQAMIEVHREAGIFQRPGEFLQPTAASADDFPLSPKAQRFYRSGKPRLQRYLPFGAATWIERMRVMLIPLVGLLPQLKFASMLYNWRIESRIYRHYGELECLEAELEATPHKLPRAAWHARLDASKAGIKHLMLLFAFSDMLYTFRQPIELARKTIGKAPKDA